MSKLILHVPDELINVAKNIAAKRQVSVSKMVTDHFKQLANEEHANNTELGPMTSSLAGCIKDVDFEEDHRIKNMRS